MKIFLLLCFCATVAYADWWETAIFYQIYPRSFKDSDNDGIGDIKGIISKLDHLKDLGVSACWLSPILMSPQVDYGYDISNFYKVDPLFGTDDDLLELFRKAKEIGIKIIMDFVPNHTSDEHEWFKRSVEKDVEFTDYYVWHDGKINPDGGRNLPPNNWQAVFNTRAWTWNEQREQYYLHQFASGQPDLNFRNPKVAEAMKNVLIFWLDSGADGFRIDAINHMFEAVGFPDEPWGGWTNDTNSYGYTQHIYTKDQPETYEMVESWRTALDAYTRKFGGETKVLMTEAYTSIENTVKFYANKDGKPLAHFPFNFILIERLDENSNAQDFKNSVDQWLNAVPEGSTSNWVLGNHDKPRFGSRYGTQRIDGLLTLLMTLPGVAVTYNGDEIGMLDYRDISWEDTLDPQGCNVGKDNFKWASRDPQRTPFQWDSSDYAGFKDAAGEKPWVQVHPDYKTNNLALQKTAPKSFYKFYKQLSDLRKNTVLMSGDFKSMALNKDVFAYTRSFAEVTLVVLINFGDVDYPLNINDMNVDFPTETEVVLAGSMSSYEPGNVGPTNAFMLRKYDTLVLKAKGSASEPSTTAAPVTIPATVPTVPTDPTTPSVPTVPTESTSSTTVVTDSTTIRITTTTGAASNICVSILLLTSAFLLHKLF